MWLANLEKNSDKINDDITVTKNPTRIDHCDIILL